jgi:predicted acetyltransferase
MDQDNRPTLMQAELLAASADQEPVLANLLELYAHDFSEFSKLELDAHGRFGYKHLSLYWQESTRHPFLIKANGNLAGFVLVQQGSQVSSWTDVWDMAEFFVVRGYRRHGIGTRAAHAVWQKFPGLWEVRVMEKNAVAQGFWRRAIASFVGFTVEAEIKELQGNNWQVFCFDSSLTKGSVGKKHSS